MTLREEKVVDEYTCACEMVTTTSEYIIQCPLHETAFAVRRDAQGLVDALGPPRFSGLHHREHADFSAIRQAARTLQRTLKASRP